MQKAGHVLRQVYSSEEINLRVSRMAGEINKRYAGEPVIAVCVLKGAFMLFSELLKHLKMPVEIDFVRLSSYGNSSSSSRKVEMSKDVECELAGRNVLIVEDIVDTGWSMNYLFEAFKKCAAKSLALACLVDKLERREVPVNVDFTGLNDVKGFLVGYGLDFAEQYRELSAIFELCFTD